MRAHNTKTLQIYTYSPSLLVFVVVIGFILDSFFPTQSFFPHWTQYVGMGIIFGGTLLIGWSMDSLRTIRNNIKNHKGINLFTGVYAYARQPDCIGYICISFGFGFLLQSLIVLALSIVFTMSVRVIANYKEEHLISEDSPMREHYIEYKKRVKRFF